jgi:hypothetical protein
MSFQYGTPSSRVQKRAAVLHLVLRTELADPFLVDRIVSFDLQSPLNSSLRRGLELRLDAEDLLKDDISVGDVVPTWKSSDPPTERVVRNRYGYPTLSKLDGKLCVRFNFNKSAVIDPPLNKIQTVLSVHTFHESRKCQHYIFSGTDQSPFHGGTSGRDNPPLEQRLVSGHGAHVNRLPFNASVRINRDDPQIMNQTSCWSDELKLAHVVLSESLATKTTRNNGRCNLAVRCSHIGRDRADCHEFNGSIAELLVWDRALTEIEIEDMEDYLCKKWRLP